MDSLRRWSSLVGSVTVATGVAAALAGAGTARPTRPLNISPIDADFDVGAATA